MPHSRQERALRRAGHLAIAGVDEAGRGALFGPVYAAAVILDPERQIRGLDDSKQLTPERREVLAERIRERAVAWGVGAADAYEIDHWNILEASRLAMRRAVQALATAPNFLLVDAIRIELPIPQKALIHGDSISFSIAAASILAKVARDETIRAWDPVFPEYGLKRHKGYYCKPHIEAIRRFGPTSLHRHSFSPVRDALLAEPWTGYPISQQSEPFPCR